MKDANHVQKMTWKEMEIYRNVNIRIYFKIFDLLYAFIKFVRYKVT